MAISFEDRPKLRNQRAMSQLQRLAAPMPFDMRLILERDAMLKLVLLLPEDVLSQALVVGRALQACAEHRRTTLEDPEEGYQRR